MPETKSLPAHVSELRELVVGYARQETLEPLRNIGRFIAFGVAGSLLLAVGLVLLALAGLRALQTETGDTFEGDWSFAPYMIVFVACLVVAGLCGYAIGAAKRRTRR